MTPEARPQRSEDDAPLPGCRGCAPKPRWRVGRKLGRTLYRDEQCVGMVDSPEIAAEIVAALNKPDLGSEK